MSLWVHAGCDFRRITEVFLSPLTPLTSLFFLFKDYVRLGLMAPRG